MFVDRVRVFVRAGDGGAGVAAFHREKGKPKGKPEGGSGGAGGDVYFDADPGASSLIEYQRRPHYRAESGTHGEGELRHGRRGSDLVLAVPLGTVVHDDLGTVVADLVEPGQRYLAARGGRGGRGNAAFVGPERRVAEFAEQGEYGEEREFVLEVKLIADAALIGFPNAGKSTLISAVSAAKPKIADYPFTTLEPNLGVVALDDRRFILADIPGLIEGAAAGKGLGHEFLRHTERARVLVVLLDPTPMQDRGWADQYEVLLGELASYSDELAQLPRLVAVNKIDAFPDVGGLKWWGEREGISLYAISAVSGAGIDQLLHAMADLVEEEKRAAPDREGYILHTPADAGFEVVRRDDVWYVEGRAAERAAGLDDLTRPEAADFVAHRLARAGVDDALRRAGARPGDEVHIGGIVFEFDPEEESS